MRSRSLPCLESLVGCKEEIQEIGSDSQSLCVEINASRSPNHESDENIPIDLTVNV